SSKHQLLLIEFQKNKELLKRPNILKEISQERSTLLGQLQSYIGKLKNDFDSIQSDKVSSQSSKSVGKNLPNLINHIICTKQIERKVEQTISTTELFLEDIQSSDSLLRECKNLLEDIQQYSKNKFETWKKGV